MKWELKPTKVPGLYRRVSDKRFVLRACARSEKTGKDVERTRVLPAGTTQDQALAVLAEMKGEVKSGEPARPAKVDAPTLRAYVPSWSSRRLSRGKWNAEAGTTSTVGWRIDKYILPELGDHLIDRITYGDLQCWLDGMAARGLAPRTIRAAYGNLCSIIRDGRQDHGFPPLPLFPEPPQMREDAGTEDLTWENYRREQGCALTREELGRFLAAAKELSPHGWYAFCVLGFGSDARFSELAAAQIQDFNLKDDVGIWLCRRHLISSRAEVAGGIKWNRKGIVRLLDAETTRILRPYLVGKEPEDLLFPSDQSGCTFRSNKGLQWFLDLVSKKAELPRMTSKVFRRTFLTLSHLDTMASAVSQAQAGHSDAKTTMTYVKPSLDARKEHARRMGGVLYAVKTDDPTDA